MDKLRGHYQVHLNGAHSKVMPQAKQHGHHNRKWWDITIIITKFWNLNAAQMKLRSAMLSRLWSWTKANGILRTELSATLSASKKGVKTKGATGATGAETTGEIRSIPVLTRTARLVYCINCSSGAFYEDAACWNSFLYLHMPSHFRFLKSAATILLSACVGETSGNQMKQSICSSLAIPVFNCEDMQTCQCPVLVL